MNSMTYVPTPLELKQKWPAPSQNIEKWRNIAKNIVTRKEKKWALIVGPCSIHDEKAAREYAQKLKDLSQRLKNFFPIMRLFLEKPRTRVGWKGIVYDPFLDGSNEMSAGLQIVRNLWVQITEMGIPCATELLDPFIAPYFDDLTIWGLIGARTSSSQPHRQLVSGMQFPVGFKNDFRGDIDTSIAGIISSESSHSHLGLNPEGRVVGITTQGNPYAHLVLRGSEHQTNFDSASVSHAMNELKKNNLKPRLLIDCSHGNSGKDSRRQAKVFESILDQIAEGNREILGMMLESHLHPGKQEITPSLLYGVSITDSCIGWEETESLLLAADSFLSQTDSKASK